MGSLIDPIRDISLSLYIGQLLITQLPTWPTDTGITKEEAEQFCDEFIKKSPAHAVCKDVGDSVADALDNCMKDILVRPVMIVSV